MRMTAPITKMCLVLGLVLPTTAIAQEKSAEDYILEAQGNMHFSCRTLVEAYPGDDQAILDVVEGMIAVSLINREIDVPNMALTEDEKAEILNEFADELGDRCADDADALLAGIVDTVVGEVLAFY